MAEALLTADDIQYFAKQMSAGNLLSSNELHDYAEQVATSVKQAAEGKPFFPPIPRTALGTIEVDFDGTNNKIIAAQSSSDDEGASKDEDLVAVIPQLPPKKPRSILRVSHVQPREESPEASPKRSKGSFWRKSKTVSVASF